MAATYIPALVIKSGNSTFLDTNMVSYGVIMSIPTPGAGGVEDGDFWAVPITNRGVVTGFDYVPTSAGSVTAPTVQSFHVFRIITSPGSRNNRKWYVRGVTTSTTPGNYGYIQASADAECCSSSPRTLPTTVPALAGCQALCEWNAANLYFGTLGLPNFTTPTLVRYFPYGYFNGVALPAAASTGYASVATLLTFLNTAVTGWAAVGTWAFANNVLTVTQSAGPGTDILCAAIIAINPSA